jgi:hypothetical protein
MKGQLGVLGGPFHFAHQEVGLICQHRRFRLDDVLESRLAVRPSGRGVTHTKRNTRQQQFRQHCFAAHVGGAEEIACCVTLPPRFKQAAFIEQHERFVQIN